MEDSKFIKLTGWMDNNPIKRRIIGYMLMPFSIPLIILAPIITKRFTLRRLREAGKIGNNNAILSISASYMSGYVERNKWRGKISKKMVCLFDRQTAPATLQAFYYG